MKRNTVIGAGIVAGVIALAGVSLYLGHDPAPVETASACEVGKVWSDPSSITGASKTLECDPHVWTRG